MPGRRQRPRPLAYIFGALRHPFSYMRAPRRPLRATCAALYLCACHKRHKHEDMRSPLGAPYARMRASRVAAASSPPARQRLLPVMLATTCLHESSGGGGRPAAPPRTTGRRRRRRARPAAPSLFLMRRSRRARRRRLSWRHRRRSTCNREGAACRCAARLHLPADMPW